MPFFPWKLISATSIASAYVFINLFGAEWSKLQFAGIAAGFWALQSSLWAFWAVILYPIFLSPLRGLPEPGNNSWWNGQFSTIRAVPSGMPMREWIATVPNDGLLRYRAMFNQERLLVTGPKALSEVLVTKNYDFEKPESYRTFLGKILGVGILLAEGDEHKLQRKSLMPAFAFRHIKELYSTFWGKGREGVDAMTRAIIAESTDPEKAKKTAVIDVGNWASRVTLDIIGVAGMGHDFHAIESENTELNHAYQRIFKPSRAGQLLGLAGLFFPDWLVSNLPIKRNEDIAGAARTIRSACRDLIREKRRKLANKESLGHDIVSVAIESGGFSDENLVDQLMTFLAAGHETTATSMTWAIYMLSRYPDVQTRLRQEIREKLPSVDDTTGHEVTSLDIDHMPYLNAVCNEVLRYWAPVPMTTRDVARDTTVMGRRVPKGTRVILAPWATNFDRAQWGPDAHEFNPDRWMPKGADDRHAASGGASSNFAYMTFLHGPRSCIGQSFAKAEFACLLATWVGRFEFALANEEQADEKNLEIKGGVTAKPSKGLHVHCTVVDGW